MKEINLLSLFSGAGGLDLGFKSSGFNIITSIDNDKSVVETYCNNFPNTQHLKKSIVEVDKNDLNSCYDGIIGGPPCQSWSEGGKQNGINDPRGKLFFEYIRILNLIKPKFFLAENVAGILQKKHSKAFQIIKQKFVDSGYFVQYKLLDAVHHGVPQNRKRVFIIGIRKDLNKKFLFPTKNKLTQPKTLRDALKDLPKQLPKSKNSIFDPQEKEKISNQIQNNEFMIGGFSPRFMARNRVRVWDEPSFTIQAGGRHAPIHPNAPKMKKITNDQFEFCKNNLDKYRRLSVRECARIQTFPDDFTFFYENISHAYKMIGNAVPVKLAEILAKNIKDQLF